MTMNIRLSRLFTGLAVVSFLSGVVLLFMSSTRTLSALGTLAETVNRYTPLGLLLSLIGTIACLMLSQLVSRTEWNELPSAQILPVARLSFKSWIVLIVLAALVWISAVYDLKSPLDWDENEHVSAIANGNLGFTLDPRHGSENHPLASLLSFVSMSAIGTNKIGARVPALILSLLLLTLFVHFARSFLSIFTGSLVLLHLLCNRTFTFYMHSMRGYIPMSLFLLVTYVFLIRLAHGEALERRKHFVGFALATLLCLFSHTLGFLYQGYLLLAWIGWMFFNRDALGGHTIRRGLLFGSLTLGCLLLYSIVPFWHLQVLTKGGWIQPTESTFLPLQHTLNRFPMVFGAARFWLVKALVCVSLATALIAWRNNSRLTRSFPFVFAMMACALWIAYVWTLKAAVLEGRMLIPLLIPFLIWLGETASHLPRRQKILVCGVVLGVCTLPSAFNYRSVLEADLNHYAATETFANRVIEFARAHPAPCFSFSGEPRAVLYTRSFYLAAYKKAKACETALHIHFARNQFNENFPLELPWPGEEVLNDYDGRTLYLKADTQPFFAGLLGSPVEDHQPN